MPRKTFAFLFFLFIAFFYSCTGAHYWNGVNPTNNTNPTPEYANYTHLALKGGLLFHVNKLPGGIGNNVEGKFSGRMCSHSIFYLVSIGDSSIEAAAKEAKINKISSISYEQFAILSFVYHRFCTVVTGE